MDGDSFAKGAEGFSVLLAFNVMWLRDNENEFVACVIFPLWLNYSVCRKKKILQENQIMGSTNSLASNIFIIY